jgi:serine/threonine-protein kinase
LADQTTVPDALSRIDAYRLLERAGSGGMGEVYFALRDGARELVVLKLLREEQRTNPQAVRRFKREAEIAAQLAHPNIVPLIESRFDREPPYIVSRLIEGQPLRALIRRARSKSTPMSSRIAVAIALETLSGLGYAHQLADAAGRPMGLVHRDLTPRNIMIAYSGEVSIIDFGVAHVRDEGDRLTAPGQVIGTIRYMAPEQVRGGQVDARTDLYTLGAVLFELLSGSPLVLGRDWKEAIRAILRDPPPALEGVSRPIAACIERALSKDPADRHARAEEMSAELRRATSEIATAEERAAFLSLLFHSEKEAATLLRDLAGDLAGEDISADVLEKTSIAIREASIIREPEEPDTLVNPPRASSRRKRRSRPKDPWSRLALLLASASVVVCLALVLTRESAPPLIERVAPAPSPPPSPVVASPRSPAAEPVSIPPPSPSAAPPLKRAPRRPESEGKRLTAKRTDDLSAMLERLRDKPDDAEMLLSLHEHIAEAARALPEDTRKSVEADNDAGLRGGDVDALARAISALNAAKSSVGP